MAIAEALDRLRAADAARAGSRRPGLGRAHHPCGPGGGLRGDIPAARRPRRREAAEPSIFIDRSGVGHYTASRWLDALPCSSTGTAASPRRWGTSITRAGSGSCRGRAEAVRRLNAAGVPGGDGHQPGRHRARLLLRGRAATRRTRRWSASSRRARPASTASMSACIIRPKARRLTGPTAIAASLGRGCSCAPHASWASISPRR